MVVGLREFTLRTEDGSGKPFLDESNGEELKQVQPSVAIVLGNRPVESPGTLYITSRWIFFFLLKPLSFSIDLFCEETKFQSLGRLMVLQSLWFLVRKIIWLSDVDMAKGYAVDFLSISLHAVSRDPEAYSSPCIYTQVLTTPLWNLFLALEKSCGLRFLSLICSYCLW